MATIRSNHKPRPVLSWEDLTPAERKEFDYMTLQHQRDLSNFFRYKGNVYDLGEAVIMDTDPYWDGAYAQSAFHAVLVKVLDGEVIVGQQFC